MSECKDKREIDSPKSASKRQAAKVGKAEVRGRKDGSTELVAQDTRAESVRLYLSGKSVAEISAITGRGEMTIYGYISQTRQELIKAKKDYFDARLALQMDDALDAIAVNSSLLADREWLKTAEPARICEVSKAYGIISDKCFVLLAAAGRGRVPAGQGQAGAEAVSG